MDISFTDRQLEVMDILWNRGSATVREAKEELDEALATSLADGSEEDEGSAEAVLVGDDA